VEKELVGGWHFGFGVVKNLLAWLWEGEIGQWMEKTRVIVS
jgi:hypothetical protein